MFVVLFSCQLIYTTKKRLPPPFLRLQSFSFFGDVFYSPVVRFFTAAACVCAEDKGFAVHALFHGRVRLMGSYAYTVELAVVFAAAVICALSDCAGDAVIGFICISHY